MAETPGASDGFENLAAELDHSPEGLREKLCAAYDSLDAEAHKNGSRHTDGEMIDVYFDTKSGSHRAYFERREPTWIQATISVGQGQGTSLYYHFAHEHEHASYNGDSRIFNIASGVEIKETSPGRPALSPGEVMLVLTGVIEDVTSFLIAGKAKAQVHNG